ncbi:hypothetical protein RV18_GL002169 [Enterococcus termitis]|nr:hypothetical protein RV18_GL002169 [Enterococcus termitis]
MALQSFGGNRTIEVLLRHRKLSKQVANSASICQLSLLYPIYE